MFSSENWFGAEAGFYNGVATQSLRFDDGSTAYLSRTISSASNRKTWTWSGWVKRGILGSTGVLFEQAVDGANTDLFYFDSDGLIFSDNVSSVIKMRFVTSAVFRDTSSWYHFVLAVDTTQTTDSDRVNLYVNGVLVTSFTTETYPPLNYDTHVNSTDPYKIGNRAYNNTIPFDGYMAEVNFVDGSQLAPTSFGETKNGVWIPIEYTGSYGTNGFRLQFNQTGTGTASSSTIGADTSGNTNHFTSSGIVASDCNMPDSPENNFSTWNALFTGGESSSSIATTPTLSDGNLQVSLGQNAYIGNTFRPTSGKWYCEIRVKSMGTTNGEIDWGWLQATTYAGTSGHSGQANKWGAYYHAYSTDHIQVYDETSQLGSNINLTISAGDVLQLAWDIDNNKGWIGINNTWYRTNASDGNPSSGSNETFTFTDDEAQNLQCYIANGTSTDVHVANFGQDSTFGGAISAGGNADANGIGDFAYAPPSGFLALCTSNLPEPTISPNALTQADDYFNTVLYTGNNSTDRNITGVGFQPDWVWVKERSSTSDHRWHDSSRGAGKVIRSNSTGEELVRDEIDSFISDGFHIDGVNDGIGAVNENSQTYVAWNWKAGGEPSADNSAGTSAVPTAGSAKIDGSNATASFAGTIPITRLSANTTAGFSIVTYTGTGSAGTINHGLSATPNCIIVMGRNVSNTNPYIQDGITGVTDPFTDYIAFNNVNGVLVDDATMWNDVAPDGNVFTVGTGANTNQNTKTYVAYLFSNVEGYSKFGSYTGNNSTNGTFVFTGFRPAFVILKRSDGTGDWFIWDNKRNENNPTNSYLQANLSDAEGSGIGDGVDFLSNGFKVRSSHIYVNVSGASHIYMAFAETPTKYSLAR